MELKGPESVFVQGSLVDQGFPITRIFQDQTHDSPFHLAGFRQGSTQALIDIFLGFQAQIAIDKRTDAAQLAPFYLRMAALDVGHDIIFIIGSFAEVNALNRARVNNRGMCSLVEVLRLVDMSHGNIIQARIFHQRARQHQVTSQHDRSLAAVGSPLH